MKKTVTIFSRIMLPAVLVLVVLGATPRNSRPQSATASPDSVTLSTSEADSLLLALDTYETQLRLARLDVTECREYAQLDSLIFAQYRRETEQSWLERFVRQPIIWFALGAYAGIQAVHGAR